ncbi:Rho GTPase activation protein [Lobosporangium transversale]|uniref:Rho GTPase activation protein n=1 Tax=Lobosporangium transversale TaxID=64571 RepID=A0A1Y2G8W0_9FUNG|nr:Rho GTPase activation protein [Lobosporangium transversale]ORZ00026.1 Rho GTPase activation protein [Lobosporangium transversale]|eukprot:XP_021876067.1 Rho GTPase activation protein [Lobosporangium transversale]
MAQQKVSFKKWWKNITGTKATKVGLFHVELVDSIVYAGVPVQYTVNGQTRCQGYIPTIVSKCGWYLKENATKARGIFRVSGSAKRVSELQLIFDTPPKYGSQLDWTGYTIHDASNVFRRYLNHLPDPVIPLEFYERFRDVHRNLTDEEEQIAAYQELISKLPPPHSCLLMYLLDLLALFAYHSEDNLMDSKNLASVFQPGVISHPNHAMSPGEYMTSAAVLKFLIDHQSRPATSAPTYDPKS